MTLWENIIANVSDHLRMRVQVTQSGNPSQLAEMLAEDKVNLGWLEWRLTVSFPKKKCRNVCIVHIMNTCLRRESCSPRRNGSELHHNGLQCVLPSKPSSKSIGCWCLTVGSLLRNCSGTAIGHCLNSHHTPLQRQLISKDQCADTKTDLFASIWDNS